MNKTEKEENIPFATVVEEPKEEEPEEAPKTFVEAATSCIQTSVFLLQGTIVMMYAMAGCFVVFNHLTSS